MQSSKIQYSATLAANYEHPYLWFTSVNHSYLF